VKIYVASSWRNAYQPAVVEQLRAAGFEVYDFKNPAPGDTGFGWKQIEVPGFDPSQGHVTPDGLRRALAAPEAVRGFTNDSEACASADACLLVLPCGRSAHLEAGWMSGRGKPVVVYAPEPCEPELMYKFFDDFVDDGATPIFTDMAAAIDALRAGIPATHAEARPAEFIVLDGTRYQPGGYELARLKAHAERLRAALVEACDLITTYGGATARGRAVELADTEPRAPGCRCDREIGDTACSVHPCEDDQHGG